MLVLWEILGGILFFGFVSFFSLILFSSLFGCFGFIVFWAILIGLVVLLKISFKWIFITGVLVYAFLLLKKYLRYKGLPDYDGYLSNNSNSYVNGKVVCKYCGSEHLVHNGLFGRSGKLRYYACVRCRNWLYRFKVI